MPFQTWILERDKEHSKNVIFETLSSTLAKQAAQKKPLPGTQRYHISDESEEWITPFEIESTQEFIKEHSSIFPIKLTLKETYLFLAQPIIKFALRNTVRWHDGAPFTAADVASPLRPYFELISKLETSDPYHVIVYYRRPFSPALNSWTTLILPAHLLEGKEATTWGAFFNRHPIGTGPFRFNEWKSNEYVRLSRNSDYFLGSPWLDSIIFRTFPDSLTLQLAFETHQVDFWNAPPWTLKNLSKNPSFELFGGQGNAYNYIGWNLQRPFFEDRSVREALAQAVNIPEMIQYLLYGNGVPSQGIFTPRLWFANSSIRPFSYDPNHAKLLLDQAGWKIGPDGVRSRDGKRFSFTLLTISGGTLGPNIATLVQSDLKKIGIEVKIDVYEWTVFLQRLMNHHFDAVIGAWALSDDFDQFSLWHSSQAHPGELNYVSYQNPRVDTLLTELRQEYSHPEIIKLAQELQQIIYHDQPYLFLFVPETTTVLWKNSYRMRYPTDHGFVDAPLEGGKAGWTYNMEWFYRTDNAPH